MKKQYLTYLFIALLFGLLLTFVTSCMPIKNEKLLEQIDVSIYSNIIYTSKMGYTIHKVPSSSYGGSGHLVWVESSRGEIVAISNN